MKAKSIFLIFMIVMLKVCNVYAQNPVHINPNLDKTNKFAKKSQSYRMLQEDPKTGKIYPDSALFLKWNKNLSKWDTDRFEIYSYNKNLNITSKIIKELDITKKNFIIAYKTDYTYNEQNQCTEEYTQLANIFVLKNYKRNLWEYDSYGNLTKINYQDWNEEMSEWINITAYVSQYIYNNNKLFEIILENIDLTGHSRVVEDYKLIYINGESIPSKIIYKYEHLYGDYGYYSHTEIYNDVTWNNFIQPNEINIFFDLEKGIDFIRTDSFGGGKFENARKRLSFQENGLTCRDSIFNWLEGNWKKRYTTSYYYDSKSKPTLTVSKEYNDTFNCWDTFYIHQLTYDSKGNIILDFTKYPPSSKYTYILRYSFIYKDTSNEVLSVTSERYNVDSAYFEFDTKVIYYPSQQSIGIKEPQSVKPASIYPNPASDYIYLTFNSDIDYKSASFQIIDLNGKILKEKNIKPMATISELIDIADMQTGFYIIILKLDNSRQYLKLIKQ
jgi:hypothetical protein